jgi:hypothetical protein
MNRSSRVRVRVTVRVMVRVRVRVRVRVYSRTSKVDRQSTQKGRVVEVHELVVG